MPYRPAITLPAPTVFMLSIFMLTVFVLATPAAAVAQDSYTGSREGFIGAPAKPPASAYDPAPYDDVGEEEFNEQVNRLPRALPPVFDSVAPPAAINEAGYAEGTASDDPCAAYLNDFNGYHVCQDRIQKIERIKAGKERRRSDYGTAQPIRPSEQRRIDAEKAAEEKARAEEEAKAIAEGRVPEKPAEQAEEPPREKTPAEKNLERKEEFIKKRPIGVR